MTAVITVVLAAAAVWYVLAPLWRRFPAPDRSVSAERARLAAERETALRVLRDLALDYATGKMSDTDYEALRGRQEAAAMDALRRLDAMDAPEPGARPGPANVRPPE